MAGRRAPLAIVTERLAPVGSTADGQLTSELPMRQSQGDRRPSAQKETTVKSWDIPSLDLKPRLPEILSSTPEARAIALNLSAGEGLSDHEVHERAWVLVVTGEVEITSATGERVSGRSGLLVEIEAAERHEVLARSDARLLLLLTPWPGEGHPGAMTLRQKLYARRRAAKRRVAT